jgi:predicted nucleic acid-binding protein
MSGTTKPKTTDRIYLDTNVFIEAVEGRGALSQLVTSLLLQTPNRVPQRLMTSEFTLSELLVKPLEMRRDVLVQVYDNWTITNDYLEVVPVTREVLRGAAELRSRDKTLKLPDAIHLSTAAGMRCKYFLTQDRRIKGQYGVEILLLTETSARSLLDDVEADDSK